MAFLTLSEMRDFVVMPTTLKEAEVDHRIREAELFDVRGAVGNPLWMELVANPTDTENADLITKLKPAIAYYAYARFIQNANIKPTKTGIVGKDSPHSTPTPSEVINQKAANHRVIGLQYIKEATDFIEENIEDYELYNTSTKRKRGGMKIVQIKRV